MTITTRFTRWRRSPASTGRSPTTTSVRMASRKRRQNAAISLLAHASPVTQNCPHGPSEVAASSRPLAGDAKTATPASVGALGAMSSCRIRCSRGLGLTRDSRPPDAGRAAQPGRTALPSRGYSTSKAPRTPSARPAAQRMISRWITTTDAAPLASGAKSASELTSATSATPQKDSWSHRIEQHYSLPTCASTDCDPLLQAVKPAHLTKDR